MPRQLRLEYAGAIYHVMNRGDRREPIFVDSTDRELFVETMGETCGKTGWQVHAYCLMGNHFHLVVETPRANLVAGMHWFLSTYTARFNRRHRLGGHLFSGRYKSLVIDGNSSGYLKTVCDYVHLNPVRARLLPAGERLAAYRWSSWPEYLKSPKRRLDWIRVDRVLGEWGVKQDSAGGRRRLEWALERRREQEQARETADWEALRRGWCWGTETFREDLLESIQEKQGRQHGGLAFRESEEGKAERTVGEMLREAGWTERDLAERAKGDGQKARMAARLRAVTTVNWAWIAARLKMGHWRTAANAVRRHTEGGERIHQ